MTASVVHPKASTAPALRGASNILWRGLFYLVGLCLLGGLAQAQLVAMVQPDSIRQVSPHVFVIPEVVPGAANIGIIIGADRALVVDTGLGPKNGRLVFEEARKLAPGRVLYLVTTHVHPEHDLGAQAFPEGTLLIRSVDEQQDIADFGYQIADMFSKRSPAMAALLQGAKFRPADISFEKQLDLDLGGVRVSVMAMGPNHTRGDTAVWVATDAVLFAGDVAMRAQPAFASPYSSVSHWLTSLDRLEALAPNVVVPSHGPVGDASYIRGYRAYLLQIQRRTAELKQEGMSADQAVASVSAEMLPSYPDAGRLNAAVRAAFREAK